jgi:hypothetical protein
MKGTMRTCLPWSWRVKEEEVASQLYLIARKPEKLCKLVCDARSNADSLLFADKSLNTLRSRLNKQARTESGRIIFKMRRNSNERLKKN